MLPYAKWVEDSDPNRILVECSINNILEVQKLFIELGFYILKVVFILEDDSVYMKMQKDEGEDII